MTDERWRVDAERIRALAPEHMLFMCVANSARGQLAEGIARSLTRDVRISSAGSVGDALVLETCARLRGVVRRLRSDEFVLLAHAAPPHPASEPRVLPPRALG